MNSWCYRYAGLLVDSEIELPEWDSFRCHDSIKAADVLIRTDASNVESMLRYENAHYITSSEYRFYVPEAGGYTVSEGTLITVAPTPDAGMSEIRLFLLGSAWGALCYQREMFVLHAGAVLVEEQAVLFCGHQKMGKSTTTACLAAHGHALISDDLCCIDIPDGAGKPLVYQSAQRFRLWRDALDALDWSSLNLERDHFRFDKFLMPWNGVKIEEPVQVQAIYLLSWGELRLTRLSGLDALQRFISAATYRGEIVEKMYLSGSYWQKCLALIQRVPVWELTRPEDLTKMDSVVELLEKSWVYADK